MKKLFVPQEGNTCTLTIASFRAELVGEIICKAENDAGEVSCTAQMRTLVEAEEVREFSALDLGFGEL